MGHNTCKSMGRVLCVVRRCDYQIFCIFFQNGRWRTSWILLI